MDELPFLAAIIEQPHEWGPRLVLADWLDEQGDPRGELIRLLHELTRLKCAHRTRKESRLRSILGHGVAPIEPIVTNSIGMQFVAIPPGCFLMGSPPDEPGRDENETLHTVRLSRGFFMGRYPVTQAQWNAVMAQNPSHFRGENLPVESVTRTRAIEFIEALSDRDGQSYRFPTEAEWEYACRAGTSTPYSIGTRADTTLVNVNATSSNRRVRSHRFRDRTTPIGSFPPNGWGLYDMHGNVWEWCEDGFRKFASAPRKDPCVRTRSNGFVLRGGSWWNSTERARSAARHHLSAQATGSAVGLRLCLSSGT